MSTLVQWLPSCYSSFISFLLSFWRALLAYVVIKSGLVLVNLFRVQYWQSIEGRAHWGWPTTSAHPINPPAAHKLRSAWWYTTTISSLQLPSLELKICGPLVAQPLILPVITLFNNKSHISSYFYLKSSMFNKYNLRTQCITGYCTLMVLPLALTHRIDHSLANCCKVLYSLKRHPLMTS